MKTLIDIISMTKDGELPDYEELRYSVCVLHTLLNYDRDALQKLSVNGAERQFNESIKRRDGAMNKDPMLWFGKDLDSPEYAEKRGKFKKMFQQFSEKSN